MLMEGWDALLVRCVCLFARCDNILMGGFGDGEGALLLYLTLLFFDLLWDDANWGCEGLSCSRDLMGSYGKEMSALVWR